VHFYGTLCSGCFRILCAITSWVPLGCVLGSVIFLVCVNGVDYVCCGSNKRQLFVEYAVTSALISRPYCCSIVT
jgi:hypothetical protein